MTKQEKEYVSNYLSDLWDQLVNKVDNLKDSRPVYFWAMYLIGLASIFTTLILVAGGYWGQALWMATIPISTVVGIDYLISKAVLEIAKKQGETFDDTK